MTSLLLFAATAWSGSITLEVTTETLDQHTVDFGTVAPGHVERDVGRRFDVVDGTFLVVEVTALATWTPDEIPPPPKVSTPAFIPTLATRGGLPGMPANHRLSYIDAAPPPRIDLYVQTTRDIGSSRIWVGPTGTHWGFDPVTRVTGAPARVAAGLVLGEPHSHELALEVTPNDSGRQDKEIVYTAIIP